VQVRSEDLALIAENFLSIVCNCLCFLSRSSMVQHKPVNMALREGGKEKRAIIFETLSSYMYEDYVCSTIQYSKIIKLQMYIF